MLFLKQNFYTRLIVRDFYLEKRVSRFKDLQLQFKSEKF